MSDRKMIYLDDAVKALERKKDKKAKGDVGGFYNKIIQNDIDALMQLPPAKPYTESNIQKMQDLEQAELEKAFKLGREDALSEIIRCKDCKHREYDEMMDEYREIMKKKTEYLYHALKEKVFSNLTDEFYGAMQVLDELPSAQPELANNSPELNKLFGELKEKYEWAKWQEWIFNPLGYALYYVWKEYDERGELL